MIGRAFTASLSRMLLTTWMAAMIGPGVVHALDDGDPTEHAIPAFARKYGVSCALCHQPIPRLNAFGETFAANGFELVVDEPPRDTIAVGDSWLRLQRNVPLAVRVDAYVSALADGSGRVVATDLQTPFGIKLLSGGQISDRISYYMYFYMSERGEVAGLEDAYVQFTDVAGSGINLMVGQFQVSDPLFKRELRLEVEDYHPYRARLGEARANLAYDRGIMATWSPRSGTDLVFEVVNGRGLGDAGFDRRYDSDQGKNVAFRLSQDLGPVRLGGFVYAGRERSEGIADDIVTWGPDATVALGPAVELNLQYLRRRDTNPFFLAVCRADDPRCDVTADDPGETRLDAAMAELTWSPGGVNGRWYFTGLFNWLQSDRPALTIGGFGTDDPDPRRRFRSLTGSATYVLKRNLRLLGEATWDMDDSRTRWTAGVVTAF